MSMKMNSTGRSSRWLAEAVVSRAARLIPLMIVIATWPAAAAAHRIHVTTTIDGEGIHAEVRDSFGKAIADAEIEVTDPEGASLAKGRTDAEGRFSFTLASAPAHVNIVAKTMDGHKASLTIERERLIGAAGRDAGQSAGEAPDSARAHEHAHGDDHGHEHADDHDHAHRHEHPTEAHSHVEDNIESGMDRIEELNVQLARQQAALDELRAQLLRMRASQSGVTVESVCAGLGLILGLTGLITACMALRRASGRERR